MSDPVSPPAAPGRQTPVRPARRTAAAAPPANVVAVASGKGGVGKTWLAITLSHALADGGVNCLLFDGDLGLANVDVQLGLDPARDLGVALAAQDALDSIVQPVEATGFQVAAGRSGSGGLAALAPAQLDALGQSIRGLAGQYDRVVLDLGAGIDRIVRKLAGHAGTGLVVTNDEPTALTDAYAYIKLVKKQRPDADLRVVVNMAASTREGERTYTTLRKACENFLQVHPPLLGVVRRDDRVPDSIRQQMPFLTRYPNSEAAQDVRALARRLLDAG